MTTTFRSGNGAPWLDLLTSLIGRYDPSPRDTLTDPAALDAWLAEFTVAPRARADAADLRWCVEVREALHGLTLATLRGERPRPADLDVVDRALGHDRPLRASLADGGGIALEPPADVAEAIARLARDAVEMLSGPNREHLHACGDETCSGIFLDRHGRRRWCSDERCGNRMRVRAHREARRRAAEQGESEA